MLRIPSLRLVWSSFLMSYISLGMWILREKWLMSRTSKRATLRTCWSRILVFVWVSPLCLPPKLHSNRSNHLWGYERGLAFVCVCVSQNRWNQVTVFLFFVLAWKVSGSDVVLGAYLIDFIRIEWVGCILFEGRKCWLLWFHFSFFWSTIPSG